jgi:UDP-glucuronate decarboxylase
MTDATTRSISTRALVTGGAGFLGSHLCERLLDAGDHVTCVDSFHTGRRENLAAVAAHPGLTVIPHDVTHPLYAPADVVYHLACPASPVHYQRDPVLTVRTAVLGTLHLLGLARRTGAVLVQASTSEVYGDPEVHPQPETYVGAVNPIGPRSCYDEGKRCAETLCFDYWRQHGVRIKVARIFNTYGPRLHPDDGRVISTFVVQALRGAPLTIHGDGRQTRSFCYVDDLIDGLVRLARSPDDLTGPVNLGNPEEISLLDLAGLIRELTGSRSPLELRPLPADDPRRRRPDLTLARERLGWSPTTPLREGLIRTIEDLDRRLRGPAR